ncbi:MAG: FMNH2-dependent alkanesulfonate monooxygenase [bacterium]|nr:FMNH2-dependent alkanesulfonate monooxygenase [bacterium]
MLQDILWFVPGHGDTRYLGTQHSRRNTSHDYLATVAKTIDSLGYSGALHPTGFGCEDSWVLASSMIPLTKHMKFLIAFRPGSLSPTLAARMAASFDRFSDGRLLLNIITGGDPVELAGDGMFLNHDERYEVTDEFLTVWRQLFTGQEVNFEGKHIQIKGGKLAFPPAQLPYPPLFFGGSSPAAIEVAGKHVDVYLTLGEPPKETAEKFEKVRAAAARHGRTMRFGVRLHVICRETEDEAWAAADDLLRYATDDVIAAHQEKLARFDSVGQGRMAALHGGDRSKLEVSPNLWAGIGLVNKGVGTALVGSPQIIADRLMEYVDLGADTFILSGYPHLEEAYRVAEMVFPLLPDWQNKAAAYNRVFNPSAIPASWQ